MRTRYVHEQLRGAHRSSCSLAQMRAVSSLVEELWARKLGAAVAAAEVPVSGVEAAIAQLDALRKELDRIGMSRPCAACTMFVDAIVKRPRASCVSGPPSYVDLSVCYGVYAASMSPGRVALRIFQLHSSKPGSVACNTGG